METINSSGVRTFNENDIENIRKYVNELFDKQHVNEEFIRYNIVKAIICVSKLNESELNEEKAEVLLMLIQNLTLKIVQSTRSHYLVNWIEKTMFFDLHVKLLNYYIKELDACSQAIKSIDIIIGSIINITLNGHILFKNIEMGIVELVLNMLNRQDHLNDEIKISLFDTLLRFIRIYAKQEFLKQSLIDVGVIGVLNNHLKKLLIALKTLNANCDHLKIVNFNIISIIAYLSDDETLKISNLSLDSINALLILIDQAGKSLTTGNQYVAYSIGFCQKFFSIVNLIECLSRLSINDRVIQVIFESNRLKAIINLFRKSINLKIENVFIRLFSNLCLNEKLKQQIEANIEIKMMINSIDKRNNSRKPLNNNNVSISNKIDQNAYKNNKLKQIGIQNLRYFADALNTMNDMQLGNILEYFSLDVKTFDENDIKSMEHFLTNIIKIDFENETITKMFFEFNYNKAIKCLKNMNLNDYKTKKTMYLLKLIKKTKSMLKFENHKDAIVELFNLYSVMMQYYINNFNSECLKDIAFIKIIIIDIYDTLACSSNLIPICFETGIIETILNILQQEWLLNQSQSNEIDHVTLHDAVIRILYEIIKIPTARTQLLGFNVIEILTKHKNILDLTLNSIETNNELLEIININLVSLLIELVKKKDEIQKLNISSNSIKFIFKIIKQSIFDKKQQNGKFFYQYMIGNRRYIVYLNRLLTLLLKISVINEKYQQIIFNLNGLEMIIRLFQNDLDEADQLKCLQLALILLSNPFIRRFNHRSMLKLIDDKLINSKNNDLKRISAQIIDLLQCNNEKIKSYNVNDIDSIRKFCDEIAHIKKEELNETMIKYNFEKSINYLETLNLNEYQTNHSKEILSLIYVLTLQMTYFIHSPDTTKWLISLNTHSIFRKMLLYYSNIPKSENFQINNFIELLMKILTNIINNEIAIENIKFGLIEIALGILNEQDLLNGKHISNTINLCNSIIQFLYEIASKLVIKEELVNYNIMEHLIKFKTKLDTLLNKKFMIVEVKL